MLPHLISNHSAHFHPRILFSQRGRSVSRCILGAFSVPQLPGIGFCSDQEPNRSPIEWVHPSSAQRRREENWDPELLSSIPLLSTWLGLQLFDFCQCPLHLLIRVCTTDLILCKNMAHAFQLKRNGIYVSEQKHLDFSMQVSGLHAICGICITTAKPQALFEITFPPNF